MDKIVAWLVAVMVAQGSPAKEVETACWHERHDKSVQGACETEDERVARYGQIATAIARVAFDPAETPAFGGQRGRHATAALLLGVSWWEGWRWRRDVDLGLGGRARGSGSDSCAMQIRLVGEQVTAEGWGWRDLVGDRDKCFRAGLRIARRSLTACAHLPGPQRLAAYASGSCSLPIGWKKSEERMETVRRMLRKFPLPPLPPNPEEGQATP